jgi:flagellar FliL protein
MKPVILALVALMFLGGSGAGAYFYFKQPAEAAIGAGDEHKQAEKAKTKSKDKGHGEGAHTSFVQIDPLILPLINNEGASQVISLVIVLETTDDATKAEITALIPRLKDAYIQDMYGALSHDVLVRDGVLQIGALKDRLHKVSNHVLGEGKATGVLLQVVQQRPI